jgi:hypothetical protein
MGQFSLWHWAIVLLVIVLVFATRTRKGSSQSKRDTEVHPVFSAVTTSGKEAEYLNQKLPRNLAPVLLAIAALFACGLLAWWFSRL